MPQHEPDYYQLLNVDHAASTEVIVAAYRRLMMKYHPDRNHEDAERMSRLLNNAKDVLADSDKRKDYDARRTDHDKLSREEVARRQQEQQWQEESRERQAQKEAQKKREEERRQQEERDREVFRPEEAKRQQNSSGGKPADSAWSGLSAALFIGYLVIRFATSGMSGNDRTPPPPKMTLPPLQNFHEPPSPFEPKVLQKEVERLAESSGKLWKSLGELNRKWQAGNPPVKRNAQDKTEDSLEQGQAPTPAEPVDLPGTNPAPVGPNSKAASCRLMGGVQRR